MQILKFRVALLAAAVVASAAAVSRASIIISEVDPTGSNTSSYGQDWYELTNTGSSAVDITGWKMDDNSDLYADAVALRGATSIAAGQSVVFVEDGTDATKDAALDAKFETAWFGTSVPAGFTIANYGGSGVGLGSSGDAVNIFDSTGMQVTGVDFGASTAGYTFDNSAGVTDDNTISTLSAVGVNGAFTSADGAEVGSPGTISSVPEPATLGLLLVGAGGLLARRKRSC